MQFIDLSHTIETVPSEPEPAQIAYINHQDGADILGASAGLDHTDFPDGLGVNLERIQLTSHTGTHVDAPLHYGPHCEGKQARSIEEIPLAWCYGDGLLLDLYDPQKKAAVTVEEIQAQLKKIQYKIQPNDIVLIHTGADRLWGTPEYFTAFRGVEKAATAFLVEQGVKIVGVDSFGFDPPFHKMLRHYQQSGDKTDLWPAHVYGREKEYCQIERLTNLAAIPMPFGFKVACFPIKIKNAGAGWSRVVAMLEEKGLDKHEG